MILSSIPSIRVWPFWISSGSKLPSIARQSKRGFDERAIARDFNRHRSVIALQHLAGRTIVPVGLLAGRLTMRFIAQMLGQLSAQHSLHQADHQFLHQAFVAQQVFRPFKALCSSSRNSLEIVIVVMLLWFGSMGSNYSYTKGRTLSHSLRQHGPLKNHHFGKTTKGSYWSNRS
jgi:hypothetical protein